MRVGQADIDFDSHEISGPAGTFSVEPKVIEVLAVLAENPGQVVTREALIDAVWGVGYGGDERLSRAVSLLRKALGDTPGEHTYIQTIPRTGYKLIATVETGASGSTSHVRPTPPLTAGRSRKAKGRRLFLAGSLLLLAAFTGIAYSSGRLSFLASPKMPHVMIMDSAHPARIYDEQVKSDGGTNADILSDILADLPIKTQKELISPSWHRYEAMLQFDPDLIVIHYSGFKQADSSGDRPQLRLLVEYFVKTDTEFLIYSRASESWLTDNLNIVLEDVYKKYPAMRDRVEIFPLLEYGEPHWMDPASSQGVKLKIKEMLALE